MTRSNGRQGLTVRRQLAVPRLDAVHRRGRAAQTSTGQLGRAPPVCRNVRILFSRRKHGRGDLPRDSAERGALYCLVRCQFGVAPGGAVDPVRGDKGRYNADDVDDQDGE
jgi:hypothetical protein